MMMIMMMMRVLLPQVDEIVVVVVVVVVRSDGGQVMMIVAGSTGPLIHVVGRCEPHVRTPLMGSTAAFLQRWESIRPVSPFGPFKLGVIGYLGGNFMFNRHLFTLWSKWAENCNGLSLLWPHSNPVKSTLGLELRK